MATPLHEVPTDIHLQTVEPNNQSVQQLVRDEANILPQKELQQAQAYMQREHQHQHMLSRIILRLELSRLIPMVSPEDWQFTRSPSGRPRINAPYAQRHIKFSISHCPGCVAVALSPFRNLGVDVEDPGRRCLHLDIAKRFFHPREFAWLQQRPAASLAHDFFSLWCIKEAHVKALGTGLNTPFSSFQVTMEGPMSIPNTDTEVNLHTLTSGHMLALVYDSKPVSDGDT